MKVNAATSRLYQKVYSESRKFKPLTHVYEKMFSKTPIITREFNSKNGLYVCQKIQPNGACDQCFVRNGETTKSVLKYKFLEDGKDLSFIYVFDWLKNKGKLIVNTKTLGVNNEFRQIVHETDGWTITKSGNSHTYKVGEPRKTEENKLSAITVKDPFGTRAMNIANLATIRRFRENFNIWNVFTGEGLGHIELTQRKNPSNI